ncbi:MAG: metal-dependent hydrolase [Natronomonas sp.]|jgi:hypothetical protein|uniref:metal-dependent hydrolase n=1 Tax=Natronomonas sp. TaxID=2184060 RepID=UPI0028708241|nr:metal-dependent hydrolase [Natronomonas sp.]MDR9381469.1 metal-dependent hydrolase [Natronomonas sp.]MDR9430610.1 metal-dependent hydrolase [Natronomonas sp.]
MMLPTHALVGMALALPIALFAPELAPAALLGGFVGGILPDLDLYSGHRKTLHFPTLYPLSAAPAALLALVWSTPVTTAAAFVLVGAAVHCRMDIYGGGLELRPWEATSDRAVYDHVAGRWIPPRRLVTYDGSKGDLGIALVVAAPLLALVEGTFVALVAGAVAVSIAYVLLRRRLAALAPVVFGRVPSPLSQYVPARYR